MSKIRGWGEDPPGQDTAGVLRVGADQGDKPVVVIPGLHETRSGARSGIWLGRPAMAQVLLIGEADPDHR